MSWQGVNDLPGAARRATGPNINTLGNLPAARLKAGSQASQTIVLNTLGDLTNREKRFAYSRFANDFVNLSNGYAVGPDGLADDINGDNVPDYYPTLYAGVFNPSNPLATSGHRSHSDAGNPIRLRADI